MSAKEAQELHQKIKDKQDTRDTMKKRVHEDRENISELQMKHNRMVSAIDKACKEVNDTLRRLVCLVNDAACIQPMDYNTSKRADPGVLTQLLQQSKIIKASGNYIHKEDNISGVDSTLYVCLFFCHTEWNISIE